MQREDDAAARGSDVTPVKRSCRRHLPAAGAPACPAAVLQSPTPAAVCTNHTPRSSQKPPERSAACLLLCVNVQKRSIFTGCWEQRSAICHDQCAAMVDGVRHARTHRSSLRRGGAQAGATARVRAKRDSLLLRFHQLLPQKRKTCLRLTVGCIKSCSHACQRRRSTAETPNHLFQSRYLHGK